MQVKVVIGTVAFMLTMMVMGFVALREPTRLETFTAAAHGRSVETGAEIFQASCASCHGVDGTAQSCVDATTGEETGCKGLPLQDYFLLCGDKTQRMVDLNWQGSKEAFILQTISSGRIGTEMPTWSNRFGGPMRDDQVQNVVDFVLNWESETLCAVEPSRLDFPELVEDFLTLTDAELDIEILPGDAVNGEQVYTSYGCVACHGDTQVEGSNNVGPWLGDIVEVGATRVEGQSALQYVYISILENNAFISPDCPTGPCASPSAMPGTFKGRFGSNPQDLADLLAFLVGTGE